MIKVPRVKFAVHTPSFKVQRRKSPHGNGSEQPNGPGASVGSSLDEALRGLVRVSGKREPEVIVCPGCQNTISRPGRFCTRCGTRLLDNNGRPLVAPMHDAVPQTAPSDDVDTGFSSAASVSTLAVAEPSEPPASSAFNPVSGGQTASPFPSAAASAATSPFEASLAPETSTNPDTMAGSSVFTPASPLPAPKEAPTVELLRRSTKRAHPRRLLLIAVIVALIAVFTIAYLRSKSTGPGYMVQAAGSLNNHQRVGVRTPLVVSIRNHGSRMSDLVLWFHGLGAYKVQRVWAYVVKSHRYSAVHALNTVGNGNAYAFGPLPANKRERINIVLVPQAIGVQNITVVPYGKLLPSGAIDRKTKASHGIAWKQVTIRK